MLSPFGWLYGKITTARNSLYDGEMLKSHSLGCPTISVGNITVGGTGKTPLVALVAKTLAARGEKVCILTRGYGRKNPNNRVVVSDVRRILVDAATGGDEPVELARKLLGKAVIVADANRVAAAKWAIENFEVTVFVLDDAFQHRRAKRDLDIVCVDATNPFGNGKILPGGVLRESVSGLSRADLIVLTRANLVDNSADTISSLRSISPAAQIIRAASTTKQIVSLSDFLDNKTSESLNDREFFLFSALGNPNNLLRQLRNESFKVKAFESFPDHHNYSQNDIDCVESKATESGGAALLTTAKDAVKLVGLNFRIPCFVVISELTLSEPEQFEKLISFS